MQHVAVGSIKNGVWRFIIFSSRNESDYGRIHSQAADYQNDEEHQCKQKWLGAGLSNRRELRAQTQRGHGCGEQGDINLLDNVQPRSW